jgi:hypothetical protein
MLEWFDGRIKFTCEHWLEMVLTVWASIAMGFLFTILYGWGFAKAAEPVCIEAHDMYDIADAVADGHGYEMWNEKVTEHLCGMIPQDTHVLFILSKVDQLWAMKVVIVGWQGVTAYELFEEMPPYIIRVQHNHDEGHPDYQDWASGKTSNCCNEKDCGDLDESEVRETPAGTEVFVHVPGQPQKWCPVLSDRPVEWLVEAGQPENEPHFEENQRDRIAARHPLAVLRKHTFEREDQGDPGRDH